MSDTLRSAPQEDKGTKRERGGGGLHSLRAFSLAMIKPGIEKREGLVEAERETLGVHGFNFTRRKAA